MFDLTEQDIVTIDYQLMPKLSTAFKGQVETEQLALDAARLLSCTEDRLNDFKDKKFFQRCWFKISGKSSSIQNATQQDLIEMQKYAWRYINLLQERDLMLADSMIAVKNNLITLSLEQDEVKKQVTILADRVYHRIVALENRVDTLEVNQQLHSWILTLDTFDYEERYPMYIRLLRVIKDFYTIKNESWTIKELRYLQKALKDSGINPKETITISDFINHIIDEVNNNYYSDFDDFLSLDVKSNHILVEDEISSPIFIALYQIKDNYLDSSKTIKILAKRLQVGVTDAIKEVLLTNISELGIDTNISLPIKDLVIEILSCLKMLNKFSRDQNNLKDMYLKGDGASSNCVQADEQENDDTIENIESMYKDSNEYLQEQHTDNQFSSEIIREENNYIDIDVKEISIQSITQFIKNKSNFRISNIKNITRTVEFIVQTMKDNDLVIAMKDISTEDMFIASLTDSLDRVGLGKVGFGLGKVGFGLGKVGFGLVEKTFSKKEKNVIPDYEIKGVQNTDQVIVTYLK